MQRFINHRFLHSLWFKQQCERERGLPSSLSWRVPANLWDHCDRTGSFLFLTFFRSMCWLLLWISFMILCLIISSADSWDTNRITHGGWSGFRTGRKKACRSITYASDMLCNEWQTIEISEPVLNDTLSSSSFSMVERRRLELPTSYMRSKRSPSWANTPRITS